MRRRTILGLAAALLAAPSGLLAQPSQRIYRVGAFQFSQTPVLHEHMRVFRERLKQLGFAEGRNLQIAEEYSAYDPAIRRQNAERLLRTRPDVILSFGSTNTLLMQQLSGQKIPVVFTIVGDPVAYRIVKDLARPAGNTTGVSSLQREMTAKRLELVREMLPKARRVVFAAGMKDVTYIANESLVRQIAGQLGLELVVVDIGGQVADTMRESVNRGIQSGADAIFVYQPMSFPIGLDPLEGIVRLGMAQRIPVFFAESDLVARGGLLSYGPDFLDETRRAADLVAKVLRGANAGDLPVDQSSRYELVVNLKTASTLGIEIPQSVRPRIDRLIK